MCASDQLKKESLIIILINYCNGDWYTLFILCDVFNFMNFALNFYQLIF